MTLMDSHLAESLRQRLAAHVSTHQPRLNYQSAGDDLVNLLRFMVDCLQEHLTEQYALLRSSNDNFTVEIIDSDSLSAGRLHDLGTDVTSIVDMETLDGITFDIDVDDKPTILITAWGAFEEVIAAFQERFPKGSRFRGN